MRRQIRIVFRPEAQSDQAERVDLSVSIEFLIRLKPLQRVDRIIAPNAVRLALEIAAIGKRLLYFGVAAGVRVELIARSGSTPGPAVSRRSMPGCRFGGRFVVGCRAGFVMRRLRRLTRKQEGCGSEQRQSEAAFHRQNPRLASPYTWAARLRYGILLIQHWPARKRVGLRYFGFCS